MRPWTKRELLAYLDRVLPALSKLDHYALLDVAPDASDAQIQAAFHSMAAGLHPDRHRLVLDSDKHEVLIVVYARIAEAYRCLRDPEQRKRYTEKLLGAKKRAEAGEAKQVGAPAHERDADAALSLLSPKAQQLYRRAIAAKRTGDLASATLNMRMALAKHPKSDFLKDALRSLKSG